MEEINIQQAVAANQHLKEKKFWSEKISDSEFEGFPADLKPGRTDQPANKEIYYFELPFTLVERLNQVSKSSEHWLHIIFVSNMVSLLYRYTGNAHTVVGTAVLKQQNDDMINKILPLFYQVNPTHTFKQLLGEMKQVIVEATEHQNYPVEKLFEALTEQEGTKSTLIKVASLMEGIHDPAYIASLDIPVVFTFSKSFDGISGNVTYHSDKYQPETIKSLVKHYLQALQFSIFNGDKKLNEVCLVTEKDKARLLQDFNNNTAKYPLDSTITALFEKQVNKTPDKIAVVYNGQAATYAELNTKANQLAAFLVSKGFRPGQNAALITDRSLEMVTAIWAILKAGGCYIPIDPKYPSERVEFIVQDSNASFVLLTRNTGEFSIPGKTVFIDEQESYPAMANLVSSPQNSSDLAYIIYTSGTTGVPKGVMVEHRSLVNLCFWHNDFYSVTSNDNATQYAGISFDAAVWEIFPYLIQGSTLHIIREELKLDLQGMQKYYEEHRITISFLPTQFCEQFMKWEHPTLRALLAGGDKLRSFEKKNYSVYNNYGPTENTVVATSGLVEEFSDNISIGKPITNNQIYILQKGSEELQPIGVPGELCIGGLSLARGYVNSALETDKFVNNPFNPGTKMYRTGDMAKWLPSGEIEFLGRNDLQVKIRGFRIEIGEIENQILRFPSVREVVVIAKTNTRNLTSLLAYVVAEAPMDTDTIKVYLSTKLPDYMIPAAIVQLESIPLTPNGKVDKKLLASLESEIRKAEYVAPQSDIEKTIVDIWKDVLQTEHVGIYDNFFDIGGNSLHIIQVHNRMLNAFSKDISVVDLFRFSTVSALSAYMGNAESTSEKMIDRSEQIDKGKNRLKNLKLKNKASEEVA